MKKILLTMTALTALAAASAPAAAQSGYDPNINARGAVSIDTRIDRLESRLEAGMRSGAISQTEAARLRVQMNQLRALERAYSRNGITQQEHAALQQRLRSVRQQIRTADRGAYDRSETSGEWAEYDDMGNPAGYGAIGFDDRLVQLGARLDAGIRSGTIDRYQANGLRQQLDQLSRLERRYTRNGLTAQEHAELQQRVASLRQQIRIADRGSYDRYEQRGLWAEYDGYAGQGGAYQEAEYCESRGGIGGLLDNILGRGGEDCGLQVGQRVTGNLSAVPYAYRNQFRDGNGVYYRSDGQQIYQIDARTQTVVRVYPMNR